MLLYLFIAALLLCWPYPERVHRWACVLCLILAALFGIGGISVILRYQADGLLLGGVWLLLGVGFLLRALRLRASPRLAN